jgi:hypothetical protein
MKKFLYVETSMYFGQRPNELRIDTAGGGKGERKGALRRRICPSWTKLYLEKEARWNWQKQPRIPKPTNKG